MVRSLVSLLAVSLSLPTLLLASVPSPTAEDPAAITLVSHLPKDPVLAWNAHLGTGDELLDSMLEMAVRFAPDLEQEQIDQGLASIDEKLGMSLRNDLLAHLGPEIAVAIDVPPIDTAVGAVMSGEPDGLHSALNNITIWCTIRDPSAVDTALRKLLAKANAEVTPIEGAVRVRFQEPESAPPPGEPPPPDVFYTLSDSLLTIGFSAETVQSMLSARTEGDRLSDGADFAAVRAQLDPNPRSLMYINLPKIQSLVADSQMLQGMVSTNEEAQPFMSYVLSSEFAATGFGATAVAADSGTRQVSFGPSWMSSGGATIGIVSAIAIPNMLNAINRARQKRTMADLRSVGIALEAYGIDTNNYPQSDGWEEVATLTDELSPTYIRTLPVRDGWGNAMLYWSDGTSYRLVSPGKDGQLDRSWDGELEPVEVLEFESDLVFSDGEFISSVPVLE
jgi:general secretion pathway protein G